MIRNLFSKLAFCLFLIVGLPCSFAAAEEVSLIPDDSFELVAHGSQSGFTSQVHMEVEKSSTEYPFTISNFLFGNSQLVPDSIFLRSSSAQLTYANMLVDRCAYSYYGFEMSDFSVTYDNLVIGLDMSNQVNGYYRYECDFYIGVAVAPDSFYSGSGLSDLTPTFTFSSAPLSIGDSEQGMHCTVYLVGENEYTVSFNNARSAKLSLIHFHLESTFNFDSQYGSEVAFYLSPVFSNMISSLSFDMSPVRSAGGTPSCNCYYNNRVKSVLYSNVDPPITPTPSPTPYPGQDTQESINAGVSQIESQVSQLTNILDVHATPVPVPEELTIDETVIDVLESMTLPDIEDSRSTMSTMWEIFTPAVWYLALLAAAIFAVSIFLWILRGGWL